MGIFGFLIGATVVGIATAVLFDSLSAKEEKRQNDMRNRYNEYESERREQYKSTVSYYNKRTVQEEEKYDREYQRLKYERLQKLKRENQPLYDQFISNLNDQKKDKQEILQELKNNIQNWNEIEKNEQQTYIRHNSLKNTLRSIEEAICKLEAYLLYLNDYQLSLTDKFNTEGLVDEPFSMTLPKDYPYEGKIYILNKSNLSHNNIDYYYQYNILDKIYRINFTKSDKDLLSNYDQNHEFPAMVIKNKYGTIQLSVAHGLIITNVNSADGLIAEVSKKFFKGLLLKYYGINMFLLNCDRINSKRGAPKGSKIKVYIKEYNYKLNSIYVTENYEDSITIAKFDKIPMICSNEQFQMFYDFINENDYLNIDDEWKIGPFEESSDNRIMKFQLGTYYGFLAEFVNSDVEGNMYLRMIRLLDKHEFLKFDNIYAAAQTSINVSLIDINSYNEEMQKECSLLFVYLINEFTAQKKIVQDSLMALYLKQWTELTKRLIEFKQYGKAITIPIEDWDYSNLQINKFTRLFFVQNKKIENFFKNEDDKKRYFIHMIRESGKEENIDCKFDIEDGLCTIHAKTEITDYEMQQMDYKVQIYERGIVVAEKRQLKALENFRKGQCSNSSIKELILHIDSLIYNDNRFAIPKIFNDSISKNIRQSQAICGALRSSNFYMIQGPPGTGKTTIIKEMILQVLTNNPASKILVVSQANVAVDNVLRGIVDICSKNNIIDTKMIIRCGNADKIDEILREDYSYNNFQKNYLKKLDDDCNFPEERIIWKTIVKNPNNKAIFNEWLLKGFQIIGATCVGLEGDYGLSTLDFDLVVIDEAGKALPGELLIPINHAKRLVIIGDHKQLPPVTDPALYKNGDVKTDDVLNDNEQDFFNKSFFERLWEDCPESNKCMLNTQFRMPPLISKLVNIFYDGELLDGECCRIKQPMMLNSSLIFIDMSQNSNYHEIINPNSGPSNPEEACALYNIIMKIIPYYRKRIVVITPYKHQKRVLKKKIKPYSSQVRIDTIDSFQGDEEDLVIFCTTRSQNTTRYFGDNARLNVAFSRAKNTLIVIGDINYFHKFNIKMKIRNVDNYIRENAKVIQYNEFIDDNFDLHYNAQYNTINYSSNSYMTSESYIQRMTDSLDNLSNRIKIEKRQCLACGQELSADEDCICFKCFNKSTTVHCISCGAQIKYSLADKYTNKKPKNQLCNNCVVNRCIICKNDVYMPYDLYEKSVDNNTSILCKTCSNAIYTSLNCIECGQKFTITNEAKLYYDSKGHTFPKRCPTCRKKRKSAK